MTEPQLLLLQNTEGPLPVLCLCGRVAVLGEYVVARNVSGGRAGLCEVCGRQSAPELAACCEALNALAVAAPGLSPEHSLRLQCALVEQLARLAGPTIALLNVNPHLVERINEQ